MLMLAYAVMALLILVPDIPLSRSLHRSLVAEPVRLAATLSRTRLIFLAIMLLLVVAGAEVVLMIGSAEAVSAFAWQAAVYADAVSVTLFAGALAKARALLPWLKARPARQFRLRASRRKRAGTSVQDRAANDDDPAPALAA